MIVPDVPGVRAGGDEASARESWRGDDSRVTVVVRHRPAPPSRSGRREHHGRPLL